MKRLILTLIFLSALSAQLSTCIAQVGAYRNVFAIGANGGYALNSVSFLPDVPQTMHGGLSFGLTGRYTSEKYFSTICSVQVELNVTQLGWTQKIETIDGEPVFNPGTQVYEEYKRDLTYIELPLLAHLAWGKERRGVNAYIEAGPQFGFLLADNITKNYNTPFTSDNFTEYTGTPRVNSEIAQETMSINSKFDYGIAAGAGIEWDIKKVGRFGLTARYYYGLGNIFSDSKRDEFQRSANGAIYVKLSYLHDL